MTPLPYTVCLVLITSPLICCRYRGPDEITRSQQLTLFALYWHYTGDPTQIFTRHHDTIMVLVNQLRAVRVRKTPPLFALPVYNLLEMIVLPGQARDDKHRKR